MRLFLMILTLTVGIVYWYGTAASFSDTVWHQYHESITYLQQQEIVKGYPDGSFWPDRSISRAEILKIVLEASYDKEELRAWEDCFSDITDQRYAVYACFAKEQGIIKGYPDGSFRPDTSVTMAEALKIGIEAFWWIKPIESDTEKHRYVPYITIAHDNTIFSKYSIRPDMPMKRWQMAFLVHQLLLDEQGQKSFSNKRQATSVWCLAPNHPADAPTMSLVEGRERRYITTIWKKYDHSKPAKLIIAFHGRTNSNEDVRKYYRLERVWDEAWIIVYPSGLPENTAPRNRSDPGDARGALRDVALFDTLVKEFSEQYCIDTDEIYVVGHSLGARFANSLACIRGDVIRGVGTVAGGTTITPCSWPTAALLMHHPEDTLVPLSQGKTALNQLLLQNGCTEKTVPIPPYEYGCQQYTECLDGAPVVRCEHTDSTERNVAYYPHTRPDEAGKLIWNFFEGLE